MSAAPPTQQAKQANRPQTEAPQRSAAGADDAPLAVDVTGLCKTYDGNQQSGSIPALCSLNLQIPRGQHLAVLGESGSGKTTLLGCLAGRIAPSRGRVEVNHRTATIHQDLRLVARRTALQNVMDGALCRLSLWRTLFVYPRAEKQRAWRLLERVGLEDRAHLPVCRLSGGEQQRVAIARSLMQDPEILLADEPVASLDDAAARDIMALLDDLGRQHNLTRISVLHDWDLADTYADRIIGLDQGRLVFDSQVNGDRWFEVRRSDAAGATVPPQGHASSRPAVRRPRLRLSGFAAAIVAIAAVYGMALSSLDIGSGQLEGMGTGLARFFADFMPDSVAQVTAIPWVELGWALVETLSMSLIGTTLGVLISWPMAALSAKNVGPRGLRHVMRFGLNGIRTVPSLIWALLFVAGVGLGPLAGVMALTAYSIGYLTKFFYEHFEAVEPGPPDALAQIGASGLQKFLFGVWPASKPAVLSSCIFMLEYNIRAASVLGIVGAGGIGYWFSRFFAWRNFPAALACLIMLLAVVVVLDAISTRLRGRLMSVAG